MTLELDYPDTSTFVVVQSGEYGNSKTMLEQFDVPVIFLQATQFRHTSFQDQVDADAVCYPDFTNEFIVDHVNRLEGMYVLEPLYGAADSIAWYKITQVVVNRDHLLDNEIDNIECRLKKAMAIPGVS